MKLSAVISTFNSRKVLKECLESLNFADEIIVVDHESGDDTLSIAKKFTKHVFTQPNDPAKIDLQKNFGFGKAKGEWILSIDADERVSNELAEEIQKAIKSDSFAAYKIPRKNIIFGRWIEHSLWWPDYQLRLFQKGKGKYVQERVHQDLQVDGGVGQLEQPLVHENYQTISQYLQKMDVYTENEADAMARENIHMQWTDAVRMPLSDFLKTFFLQAGYKDGLHGLVLSILQAFYSFLVFAKVWQKQGFREEQDKKFTTILFKEWLRAQHEISYWFFSSFVSDTHNPLRKLKYSLLRRRSAAKLKKSA
ncbi:MAG TPA: glycosyltransferase family 2 protein [Patescibacteria group bacterium]|nr:glycosyltransferase family 2 protein [Patescibacteria group bacterium]